MMDGLAAIFLDHGAGRIARGDDGVISVARNTQLVEHGNDRRRRAWRIGDQHRPAPIPAEGPQRLDRLGKGGNAIVQNTPDIAEDGIVPTGQIGQARDDGERR